MRKSVIIALIILASIAFLFNFTGCSANMFNNGASHGNSGQGQGGAVAFNWGGGKYLSPSIYSLYISITGEGLTSASTKTVAYSSNIVTFDNLPLGNKTAEITAYDALSNILSKGRVSFIIEGGKTTSVSITLGIVFTDSSFSPSAMTIPPGTILYFYNAGNSSHNLTGSSIFNGISIASGGSASISFTSNGTYVCYLDSTDSGISATITVSSAPQITGVSPSSGQAATLVTITGTGFGSSQGSSTVIFNGTFAVPESWSDTQIVCLVPGGATTGNVVVRVSETDSNGSAFTIKYMAYVVNRNSHNVTVVDLSSYIATATFLPGGTLPSRIAINSSGTKAYVTVGGASQLGSVNLPSNLMGVSVVTGTGTFDVAIAPNGNFAYVTNSNSNTVTVVDLNTTTWAATIDVLGTFPNDIAITPNGNFAYVANGGNSVSKIQLSNNAVSTVGVADSPQGVAVSADGSKVYVTRISAAKVSIIQTSDFTIIGEIGVGATPWAITVAPNGLYAYVANRNDDTISVIRLSDNFVTATFGVGDGPTDVAFTPDGIYACVTNENSNDLYVIRTSDNSIVAIVGVGTFPQGVAITP